MTVGIDIRFLAKGTRSGIEEYTINLLSRLLSLDKNIKFKLFYNAFNQVELDYDWLNSPNVELKKFRWPNRFIFDPAAKLLKLPKIDRMLGGCDVFFAPHFLLSPVSKKCRKVVAFHDLSFEYFPEFFSWRKRFWHNSLAPRQRALEADKIIAVSQSTKDDLVSLYSLPAEKIKVIYSGIEGELGKKGLTSEQKLLIRKKYNLPENFILYFGTLEPRKNLVGLIQAYEVFRQQMANDKKYSLVLAGNSGWLCDDIFAEARKSDFAEDIIFTGFISPSDKIYLYNMASLFVYPSFFEGFGFPPLEAMSCGVPVICSHTSSFPEVVGEAALMIDPYNFDEIAWAMKEVLSDRELKQDLVEDGFARIKNFSWNKCAEETLSLLLEK